jgi:HEAT repeat protein
MVRRSAVNALRDLEGRRVRQDTALRELLHDPDPEVRRTAETVLGLRPAKPNLRFRDEPWHRRTPRAAELKGLRATLRSSSSKDRERAVHELATLVGDGVIPMLLGALKDESKQVRQAAAEAAGDTGDPQVLPALTLALRDSNEHVRQAAAGSFGKIGPAAAEWLPALIAATGDPNEHVRQAAVDALGDLAHPAATNALLASLADPNPFVRQGALDSLVELRRSSQRAH